MRVNFYQDLILEIINNSIWHNDADAIYMLIKEQHPNISVNTVYLNLKKLTEAGKIRAINVGKKIHYDKNTTEHAHLICQKCGIIVDLQLNSHYKTLLTRSGFYIKSEQLTFFGLCRICTKQEFCDPLYVTKTVTTTYYGTKRKKVREHIKACNSCKLAKTAQNTP